MDANSASLPVLFELWKLTSFDSCVKSQDAQVALHPSSLQRMRNTSHLLP
jgi:hypothetical protein